MSVADALGYACFIAAVALVGGMALAAFRMRGWVWVFELLGLLAGIAVLSEMQLAGRNLFIFKLLAFGVLIFALFLSAVAVVAGRYYCSREFPSIQS